ncbi:MAG: hypothetical protein IPP83_15920 [Flavobacteriales bacterium]|nr:hypothetical protein [Flavobacteriales bacterium]
MAHITLFIVLPILFTPFAWWQVADRIPADAFHLWRILGTVFQLAHLMEGAQQPIPDANDHRHGLGGA